MRPRSEIALFHLIISEDLGMDSAPRAPVADQEGMGISYRWEIRKSREGGVAFKFPPSCDFLNLHCEVSVGGHEELRHPSGQLPSS